MKKFKNLISTIFIILSICGIIYTIGYIKYKIWRAEHPQAKTWIFFIPKSK